MERSNPLSRELHQIRERTQDFWRRLPRRQRWTLCGAVLLTAIGGASNTVVPLLLGRLVDVIHDRLSPSEAATATSSATGSTAGVALFFLSMIALAYLLREAMQVGRRFLIDETCTRLEKHLTVKLVSHILQLELMTLTRDKVGTLHSRVVRSVAGSMRFLRVVFIDFLPALLTGGLALTAATAKQPMLGLVMVCLLPGTVYLTWRQLASQKGVRLQLLKRREEIDGTLVEQLTGIDYIRAANTHQYECERIARGAEGLRRKELRHHIVMSLYGSGKALAEAMCHVAVLAVAVWLAVTGRGTVGDILAFSMLFLGVMAPLSELHRIIDEGHESSLLVAEMLDMLGQPVDPCYQLAEERRPALEEESLIHLDGLQVRCTTPDGQVKQVLSDVSLDVRRGEVVGIAGRSGCGKSTLLRALLRLVHPSDGAVLLGGTPLHSVSRQSLAELLGYVSQSPFVFAGTVEENIAYERLGATAEDIRRAAEFACLHEEIMQFPGGYKAILGERGQNLSGGQRQRLALARVILKDPPILILDEATSALDTISEAHIQSWLDAHRGRRTVLIVAHRLSTLRHSDRILVFDEGRIVEAGPYDELLARGGLFAELNESAGIGTSPMRT